MKQSLLNRFRGIMVFTNAKGRRRGVAIITVMAVVSLMTILVVSFFNMARSEKITSLGSVEMQRVLNVRDTALNFVVAQIREGTTLRTATENTIWSSGPGWIQTYATQNKGLNRIYKLYSSDKLIIKDIDPFRGEELIDEIEDEIPVTWNENLDRFVDLNRPTLTGSSLLADSSAQEKAKKLSYPVADPRRYDGIDNDDSKENTEGFTYGKNQVVQVVPNGVDPRTQKLAMPLKWVYLLEDGTMGTIDSNKNFDTLTEGGTGERPSKAIPIVARVAWWADDESCKINVNTASVPVPWDTPLTTSNEDKYYADFQPVEGEYQHYPAHPAQVDLTAVFFPGRRYQPPLISQIPLGSKKSLLRQEDANLIWNIAPYISEKSGTSGGTVKTNVTSPLGVVTDDDDHLYASFQEMYFKAQKVDNDLSRQREDVTERDSQGNFLKRLEQSKFFLTHRSHAPEMTVWGTPRICMFPIVTDVEKHIAQAGADISKPLPADIDPYEVTLATNANLRFTGKSSDAAKKFVPYYFRRTRTNQDSRHQAWVGGAANDPRLKTNSQLLEYLKFIVANFPAGYPELDSSRTVYTDFSKKYPAPVVVQVNPDKTQLANLSLSPHRTAFRGNAEATTTTTGGYIGDASDRTQILWSMIDKIRATNLNSPMLDPNAVSSGGVTTGICGCTRLNGNTGEDHNSSLGVALTDNVITPKGAGRTLGVASATLLINNVAVKRGTLVTPATTDVTNLVTQAVRGKDLWNVAAGQAPPPVVILVQLGLIVQGFAQQHGWGPMLPRFGYALGVFPPINSGTPFNPVGANSLSPLQVVGGGSSGNDFLPWGTLDNSYKGEGNFKTSGILGPPSSRTIPWGGMMGSRHWSAGTITSQITAGDMTLFPPLIIEGEALQVLYQNAGRLLRLYVFDGTSDSDSNIIQSIDLTPFTDAVSVPGVPTGLNLANIIKRNVFGASDGPAHPANNLGLWPTRGVTAITWTVPHGDYRLTTTPIRVKEKVFVPMTTNEHTAVEATNDGKYFVYRDAKLKSNTIGAGNTITTASGSRLMHIPATASFPVDSFTPPLNPAVLGHSSLVGNTGKNTPESNRSRQFTHGRLDGVATSNPTTTPPVPFRGSSDPLETGDFDNGTGPCPDGPYANHTDDGDWRPAGGGVPYFSPSSLTTQLTPPVKAISNRIAYRTVRSPVDFGSIPTGVNARVPWQTLRFRPDPGMHNPSNILTTLPTSSSAKAIEDDFSDRAMPFSNFCGPKDHMLLDAFWMPIVYPWAISENFSTKGKINLNQQIYPWLYIQRTTALHALLRSERMGAIPTDAVNDYKSPTSSETSYRFWINAKETIKQLVDFRYRGVSPENTQFKLPFNSFRSASEVCELWLVPEDNITGGSNPKLPDMWGGGSGSTNFWLDHLLTGDNMRERPYSNIYPKTTTRSNVFTVHLIAQTLKKSEGSDAKRFDSVIGNDQVTAEWRGSAMVERVLNPEDPQILNTDFIVDLPVRGLNEIPKVDQFYTYRVTEVKQLTD